MGTFLGAIGGLLMIVLVVVLALCFLMEMGAKWNGRELVKVLIPIFVTGLIMLMLSGIYCTMKVQGTSILDIQTIWQNQSLLFMEIYPFNWYVSLGLGVITFWNIYVMAKNIVGKDKAMSATMFALAMPGSYLLFLPVYSAIFAFAFSIIAVVVVGSIEDDYLQKVKMFGNRYTRGWIKAGYPVLLALLALLNGATMVAKLGG